LVYINDNYQTFTNYCFSSHPFATKYRQKYKPNSELQSLLKKNADLRLFTLPICSGSKRGIAYFLNLNLSWNFICGMKKNCGLKFRIGVIIVNQCDHIGLIIAQWAMVWLGKFFEKHKK
jgi:hypothetical protein